LGLYIHEKKENKRQFIARLEASLGRIQPLLIRDNQNILHHALKIFDRTFTVTKVLRLVALIVAFIGIISTLLALQLERQHEMATLRAIGLTRRESTAMLLIQGSLLGLIAGIIALPVGQAMAWILIDVVNVRAFGWTMTFDPAWVLNFQSIGFSLLAALLASLYPAWRFSHTSPVDGLREAF
jgi:putative ABC transport system permease protein